MTDLAAAVDRRAALDRRAAQVRCELQAQDDAWGTSGWTRRRFLAGVGMAGAAALGTQLVTSRAAYAASPSTTDRSVVVVFLRGAADGLRVLVPNAPSLGRTYLSTVRPNLLPGANRLIALPSAGGWAVNDRLQPLYDRLWATGEMAFVPAVSDPGIVRSHFAAQQYLERGGAANATTGWLERLLQTLGPGTTFRTVAEGATLPAALTGSNTAIGMSSLSDFSFPAWEVVPGASQAAVDALYRGLPGTVAEDVRTTMSALSTAAAIRAVQPSVTYPNDVLSNSLKDIATILRAEVGMQVATLDVGGWDTHTNEATDLDNHLGSLAAGLAAFLDDLGPTRRKRVTVVVMTEFGRRVAMNNSGGTDHGHGSVMWLLGGGLTGSGVYGAWNPLSDATLDQGDVPGLNNPFDVLGEVVRRRLNAGSLSTVFPGHTVAPLGVMAAS